MTPLDQNFRDLLSCFNSKHVRYLLVGGYAVNFHGHHRNTKDIDLWVEVSQQNAVAVSEALQEFGFPATSVSPQLFLDQGKVYAFGRLPYRVDLLTQPSGVNFEGCFGRRIIANLDGVEVPIIAKEDLIANKRASGRLRDLADVEELSPSPTAARKKRAAKRKRR